MTRDQFAAAALAGLVTVYREIQIGPSQAEQIAQEAFLIADAMMAISQPPLPAPTPDHVWQPGDEFVVIEDSSNGDSLKGDKCTVTSASSEHIYYTNQRTQKGHAANLKAYFAKNKISYIKP